MSRNERTSHPAFVLACVVASVGGVALGVRAWQRYGTYPGSPVATTLDEVPRHARGNAWVSITNATWRCEPTIRPLRGDSRQVALWDGRSSVVVIADFDANVECSSLTAAHARGTVSRLDRESKYFENLEENGLRLNDAADAYALCTYCGPRNELSGVFLGLALTGIGVGSLLWHLATKGRRSPRRA